MLSESILEITKRNRHKFVGSLTHSKIRRLIDDIFKEYRIKTVILQLDDIEIDSFFIGGYYQDFDVVVELSVSTKSKYLVIENDHVDNFLFLLSQVICHELIHYMQDIARNGNMPSMRHSRRYLTDDQKYLSDPDEIQAYAHDVAMELQRHYPNDVLGALRKASKKRKSVSLKYYNKTFGWTDVTMHRLLSHTYKWLMEK